MPLHPFQWLDHTVETFNFQRQAQLQQLPQFAFRKAFFIEPKIINFLRESSQIVSLSTIHTHVDCVIKTQINSKSGIHQKAIQCEATRPDLDTKDGEAFNNSKGRDS
ncbi:hypothetical protein AMR75_18030 [Vibrio fluvialis]|nr:hypothetical protein AMR75_18030 [Vibrio fluvialis]